jgi:hypothetical protein
MRRDAESTLLFEGCARFTVLRRVEALLYVFAARTSKAVARRIPLTKAVMARRPRAVTSTFASTEKGCVPIWKEATWV